MKRRSGASVPGMASRWGCRRGGACRCGGSSAAPGAWRRVKSGRASPACHENKETKGAVMLLFFRARENVRWVSVEASGPRLGRSPAWGVCRPPAPLGCAPCAPFGTRAPATCHQKGGGVISFENVDCDYVIDFLWFVFCILFLITCCNFLHIKCSIF